MICKTTNDLSKYGAYILGKNHSNLIINNVVKIYLKDSNINEIWIIEDVKLYSDEIYDIDNIEGSKFFKLVDILFDLSENILMWYSNYYEDLNIVDNKEGFLGIIKENMLEQPIEIYVQYTKK